MRRWAAQHPDCLLLTPDLPVDPQAAMALLEDSLASFSQPPGLIGSSLGGFYANVLAARHGLPAVLINPAVHPHQLLRDYVGVQANYHTGVAAEVTPAHFDFLERIEVAPRHPQQIRVLLETGDETLDYRQAVQFYAGCEQDITEGGSHAYESFPHKIDSIVAFLNQHMTLKN